MVFYVYMHLRPDGSPFYVGKGKGGRSHDFLRGRNQHHKRIVAKHGQDSIEILVFEMASEQEALETEIAWIRTLREQGIELTNISSGGDSGASGCKRSEEVRKKQSESALNMNLEKRRKIQEARAASGYASSAETRRKQSEALRGKPGRPHTQESKAKLSAAGKGRKPTDAARLAASIRMLGNTYTKGLAQSEETKRKRAIALLGNKSRTGQTQSEIERARKSASLKLWWENRKRMSM